MENTATVSSYVWKDSTGQLHNREMHGEVFVRCDQHKIFLTRQGDRYAVYYGWQTKHFCSIDDALKEVNNCLKHAMH